MTHIAVFASGSRGDVQPYIALAQGLQQAGHNVLMVASQDFETLATEAGLPFGSTGPSIEAAVQSDEWRQALEGGNFLSILRMMQSEMKKAAAPMVERLPGLLQDSDLVIAGMAGLAGLVPIAEQYRIPIVQAFVVPFTPTSAYPSPIAPALPLGGPLNKLSYTLTHQVFWQNTKTFDRMMREKLGAKRSPVWGPYRWYNEQGAPVLYGFSRHVLPRPDDWDERQQITGYWFLDEPDEWSPPAELLAFLAAGPPPVYIGFGSMGSRNPEEAGQMALEALALAGQRGVLAAGWGGLQPSDVPESVQLIGAMPHSWLFPRMAAVVHHGGVGTTAAGLRAGVPSVVVPFMADQPFWGRRLAALGAGPAPIPRKQLTAGGLAEAITRAVTDESMRQEAAELGRKIRAEDGVATAVAVIERFIKQKLTTGPRRAVGSSVS